ncbi:type II toxin-antitoxin system HicB family antitoxin [Aridibaculum aurantiacum]|uniref:type II toxin-antitoxin system HicB family antitoxin n=1 Tax=Aridibaculum aurantiacum TaxID=2810307 RepID=UPI001A9783BB|nr:type II toxin-antitoxin system HicB family antitoxin [Aridibaculum aurantiacum]
MVSKYEVIIFWSEEDGSYIAEMPELKGCLAHGDTQDEALREVKLVAEEWIKLAQENSWHIPEPKGRLIFA